MLSLSEEYGWNRVKPQYNSRPKNDKRGLEQSKQSICNTYGWSVQIQCWSYCLLNYWTRLARMEETSVNENKSNQTILEIDFEFTRWNGLWEPFDGKSKE